MLTDDKATADNRAFRNGEHIGEYIELGNEQLHYIDSGEGEVVLLIHSEGQSLYTWHCVYYQLSQYFRVIALDLFGHGYSSAPDIEYSIRQHGDTIREFLNALSIDRAHVIAFSMGAIYAMDFVQRYPEMVGRLIIISPGGLTPQMPFAVRMFDSRVLIHVAKLLFNKKKARELLEDCFFDKTLVTGEMIEEYYTPLQSSESRDIIGITFQNFDEEEVLQNLRNIEVETMILWGVDDGWHPIGMANVFQLAIKNSQMFSVRNCGHMLHEEKPERFLELALPFLAGDIFEQEKNA